MILVFSRIYVYQVCVKIEFSNRQSTMNGITLFPDGEVICLSALFELHKEKEKLDST